MVARDWDRQPIVDVVVLPKNATEAVNTCPADYPEFIMGRMFYGLQAGCDCLGVNIGSGSSKDSKCSNKFMLGDYCKEEKQFRYNCKLPRPMMPFEMHFFDNMMICGQRGGTGFINATRVDADGNCPSGFAPCSTLTSLENTICYDNTLQRDKVCPITGFEFSIGESTLPNPVSMKFSETVTFSYSRDVDA